MESSANTLASASYTDYARLPHMMGKTGNDEADLRQAAQHFESLFIDMWMKSARQANETLSPDGMLNSPELKLHQEMADHETAVHLARHGGVGLADVIVRQLRGEVFIAPNNRADASTRDRVSINASEPSSVTANPEVVPVDAAPVQTGSAIQSTNFRQRAFTSAEEFVTTLRPIIQSMTQASPLPALGVLSQAALETGWGSSVIADATGKLSHNLFGIKAGADTEQAVSVRTREYELGQWVEKSQRFRDYPDWQSSIQDYLSVLSKTRYAEVTKPASSSSVDDGGRDLAQQVEQFARGLQQAGYATDPAYARKIMNIAARIAREF